MTTSTPSIPDNKKIYDETWADWVDMKKYGPASRWLHALLRRQLAVVRSAAWRVHTVLDVGCGEGTVTNLLHKELPEAQVTGIDFSASGIACAQHEYPHDKLRFVHDEDSALLDGQYDLVSAFEVLEHVEDWQEVLGRMADASTQYLLLSFPVGRMRPFEVHVGHLRNFKKGEVEAFLATKGFVPKNIFYAGFPFYNPLYREVCNLTDSGSNTLTKGKYGWFQKLIGSVLLFMFDHLSTRRRFGNQFCGLFVRAQ
jgi:SAM-dependent methyltransferase